MIHGIETSVFIPNPVDLEKFASDLDEAEKTTMDKGGFDYKVHAAAFCEHGRQWLFPVQVQNYDFNTSDPLPSLLSVMIIMVFNNVKGSSPFLPFPLPSPSSPLPL